MFSFIKTKEEYQITIFGKKNVIYRNFSKRVLKKIDKLGMFTQNNFAMEALHSVVFPKYQNCHQGEDVVILGTGPTLQDYVEIKDAIHIGVNSAVLFDKLKLDYLFVLDVLALKKNEKEILNYQCKKFFGITGISNLISDQYLQEVEHERYFVDYTRTLEDFPCDISHSYFTDYGSVIFSALQFALWTNPKRIYLVGCDCTNLGYFNSSAVNDNSNIKNWLKGWLKLKQFQLTAYPKTEIISIRPVGLKGIFSE